MASVLSTSFFLLFSLALLSLTPSATAEELATTVCKKTTDFKFCHDALYADPKTPQADTVSLAYIAFRQASQITRTTSNVIAALLKSKPNPGLVKCRDYYNQASNSVIEAISDLDSESYDMVGVWTDFDHAVKGCAASVTGPATLSKANADLIKYANICTVISQLFVSA